MDTKTILVVEDDRAIREVLQMVLETAGYRVETAQNGREGVDVLCNQEPPAMILLDLMMPVMNGWEFLSAKRQDPRFADIPVVVLSASGHWAKPPGATAFVEKPIELGTLLSLAEEYCGTHQAASAVRA